MFEDILRNAFTTANRRAGVVFIDLIWKGIWLVLTLGLLFLVFGWYSSQLQSIEWQDTGIPALNGVLAATLLREFWDANRGAVIGTLAAVFAVSAILWILLEAYFRAYVVAGFSPRSTGEEKRGMKPATTYLFAAYSVGKLMILGLAGLFLGLIVFGPYLQTPVGEWQNLWPDTRGAIIAAVVALLALAFLLTLFETLLRTDAIELLGTDLIRVSGVLGILMAFEAMIVVSVASLIVAGFLNIGRMAEALVMLGFAGAATVILILLHGYLLLVRFSAMYIMRRDVIEI